MATPSAIEGTEDQLRPVGRGLSWLDRLQGRVDQLPGSPWVWYALAGLVVGLALNASAWAASGRSLAVADPGITLSVGLATYLIALAHELDRVAARCFERFSELLPPDHAWLRRQLLELPSIGAIAAPLLGFSAAGLLAMTLGADTMGRGNATLGAFRIVAGGIGLAALALMIYRTVRQLRVVTTIHAAALRIDPLDLQPVLAFSSLTARTGMGLIAMPLVALLFALILRDQMPPELVSSPLASVPGVTVLALSTGTFIVPLVGLHERLLREVQRLRRDADHRLAAALAQLHNAIEEQRLSDADAINKTINSAIAERDVLARVPTWPWQAGTIRAFLTALSLPVLVWLVTRLLDYVL